jgi:hypothetical protein
MPKVRTGTAAKWGQNAAAAGPYYEQGVRNPRQSWSQATQAAAANQAAGVQKAITEGRFQKGVQKAGDAKWTDGVINKGVVRFSQGVQAGQGSYETGVTPYLQTIESTTLPPRYPKGDPRNLERVKAITTALSKKKASM